MIDRFGYWLGQHLAHWYRWLDAAFQALPHWQQALVAGLFCLGLVWLALRDWRRYEKG